MDEREREYYEALYRAIDERVAASKLTRETGSTEGPRINIEGMSAAEFLRLHQPDPKLSLWRLLIGFGGLVVQSHDAPRAA